MAAKTAATIPANVQSAREALLEQRATLTRWTVDAESASAELADLQERIGATVLDDPDAAIKVTEQVARLQARREVAGRAIEAQRPRVAAAETVYLLAEADGLEKVIASAEAKLETHRERTAALLAELKKHEGVFVPASGGGRAYELRQAVDLARLRVEIVQAMARGEDPDPAVQARQSVYDGTVFGATREDVYPPCVWGPDALVPCPAYLDRLGFVESERLGAIEAQEHYVVAGLERKVVAVEAELQGAEFRVSVIAADTDNEGDLAIRLQAVADCKRLTAELDAVRAELATEQAHLVEMVGADVVERV